jgi:head-tail adaptor
MAGRLGGIDRDGDRTSKEHIVSGAERTCRERRPNVRLNLDAVNAERLVKLKRYNAIEHGNFPRTSKQHTKTNVFA